MTPGTTTLPFYRGAKWSHIFTFTQTDGGTAVDLTGLGPFVCEVERVDGGTTLGTATITSSYNSTGIMTIEFSASVTRTFPVGTGTVRLGLRDALNNPYLIGVLDVVKFAPDPA